MSTLRNERTIRVITEYLTDRGGSAKEKKIMDHCEGRLRFFSPNKVRGVLQHTPEFFTQVKDREWALTACQ